MHKDCLPKANKRELLSSIKKGVFLIAIAYLALTPITINAKSTKEILSTSGDEMVCSIDRHYNIVASLGAGIYKTPEGNYAPTTFGRGRLDSAALLYVNKKTGRVVLLTGFQGNIVDPNIELQYLQDQVKSFSKNEKELHKDDVYVESNSTSTATNLDALKTFIAENKLEADQIAILTNRIYEPRVRKLLKIKGINNACILTVEKVFGTLNPDEMKIIRRNNNNSGKSWREISEKFKTFALFYDPQGRITSKIESLYNLHIRK